MRRSFTILIFLSAINISHAQVDPHFSQFYAYPLWLNPGMTGVMDGSVRVTGVYRNQWSNVMTPFITSGVSIDVATEKKLNFGVNFLNQSAGDGGYKYLNAYGTIAYGIRFGKDETQQITMGIQAGLLSRRFDPARFQFGDQWNPVTGYDPANPTTDILTKTSASVLDIGAGLSYFDGSGEKNVNLFAGFGVFHLTQPEDPFINASAKSSLPMRFSAHAGARITVNPLLSFIPNLLYLQQGNASEKMLGLTTQFNVNEYTDVLFGANYRLNDAISPFFGVSFRDFVLGLSYDINSSDLGKAVQGTNSLEISFTYISRKTGKPLRYLSCPRF